MLQKKAATKGLHQGVTWEGVSSQKEQKCVTVKNSKAYTPEASSRHSHREAMARVLRLGISQGSRRQAEPRRWKTKPREAGPLSFQACKKLPQTAAAPSWEKWSCTLHLKRGGVKAAKRLPSGGGYLAGRH